MTSEGALTTATSKPAKMIDRLSSKVGFTQEGSVPQPLGSRPAATGNVPVNHMGSLRRRDRAAGAPHVASTGPLRANVDSVPGLATHSILTKRESDVKAIFHAAVPGPNL